MLYLSLGSPTFCIRLIVFTDAIYFFHGNPVCGMILNSQVVSVQFVQVRSVCSATCSCEIAAGLKPSNRFFNVQFLSTSADHDSPESRLQDHTVKNVLGDAGTLYLQFARAGEYHGILLIG
jgi:hypothetical protein